MDNSEKVEARSRWHPQSGHAEIECNEILNTEIDKKQRALEEQGYDVIGTESSSIEIEESVNGNGELLFRGSASAFIHWK